MWTVIPSGLDVLKVWMIISVPVAFLLLASIFPKWWRR